MRVKTADTYRRRFAARGRTMAPKTRISDYLQDDRRSLLSYVGVTVEAAWKSKPNHATRTVTVADVFPQLMGEEKWLV